MLIGSEPENGRYVAYWLDTFGGRFSEKVFGTRDGHSVRFVFRSSDGLLQNTFIWNVESQTWRWLIEQQDEQGQWLVFAEDSLRRMQLVHWPLPKQSSSGYTWRITQEWSDGIYKGNIVRTNQTAPKNIDEYIAGFPQDVQGILEKIRITIRKAAPDAEETIKYRMPTFTLNGNLVHFAAFKNHIGFYPVPTGIEKFKKELAVYEQGKGSVQFPLDQPIPYSLISKIVKFRVKENLARTAKGKKK